MARRRNGGGSDLVDDERTLLRIHEIRPSAPAVYQDKPFP